MRLASSLPGVNSRGVSAAGIVFFLFPLSANFTNNGSMQPEDRRAIYLFINECAVLVYYCNSWQKEVISHIVTECLMSKHKSSIWGHVTRNM